MKRVIRNYYFFQIFFSLLLWLPIFYEYQKRIGLSDPQIFGIQTIYYLVFCGFELPTGFLADKIGFRASMILGGLTLTLANTLPVFTSSYSGFLSHFILIALARSFVSGASSAYLYESMALQNATDDYKKVEGRARAYSLVARIALWPIAGYAMNLRLDFPYMITALFSFVSLLCALRLPSLPKAENVGLSRVTGWKQFAPVIVTLKQKPYFILLMVQGTAIFVLVRVAQVNLYQPIMKSKHFDVNFFGTAMSLMTIFEAVGTYRPEFVRRYMSDTNAVFAVTLIIAASLSGMANFGQSGTLISFFVFSLAAGLSFPIQRQLMNDNIPDPRFRASFLSLESLLDRAISASVAPLIGYSLEKGIMEKFLNCCAGATAVLMSLLYFLMKHAKKENAT